MAADQQNRATGGEARQSTIMGQDWCNLVGTPWVPLEREEIRRAALVLPGHPRHLRLHPA